MGDDRFGGSVQQFVVYRFSGRNVQTEGIFLDGGKFFHRAAYIQFRQVTGFTHDGIVQYDGGPQFKSGVHHDHLFQAVVGRGIGGCRGQYLYQGVGRSLDDVTILLTGVGFVDFQFLEVRVIHDKGFSIQAVHGGMREQGQFLLYPYLLAAVGPQGIGLRKFAELRFRCGFGRQDSQQKHSYDSYVNR